jgi:hypothetical protein
VNDGSAALATTSTINSTAASATGPLYTALFRPLMGSGKVRVPQIGPASISSTACSAVTPHSGASVISAQSNDDGPRSPFGPGCTMIVRHRVHTSAGTRSRRNGQMTRSGSNNATAETIASALVASSRVTS